MQNIARSQSVMNCPSVGFGGLNVFGTCLNSLKILKRSWKDLDSEGVSGGVGVPSLSLSSRPMMSAVSKTATFQAKGRTAASAARISWKLWLGHVYPPQDRSQTSRTTTRKRWIVYRRCGRTSQMSSQMSCRDFHTISTYFSGLLVEVRIDLLNLPWMWNDVKTLQWRSAGDRAIKDEAEPLGPCSSAFPWAQPEPSPFRQFGKVQSGSTKIWLKDSVDSGHKAQNQLPSLFWLLSCAWRIQIRVYDTVYVHLNEVWYMVCECIWHVAFVDVNYI